MVDKNILYRAYEVWRNKGVVSLASNIYSTIQWMVSNSRLRHRIRLLQLKQKGYEITDANPFKKIYVSPEQITGFTGKISQGEVISKNFHPVQTYGIVADGDWDRQNCSVEELDLFSAIEKRYHQDIDWEETEYYIKNLDEISTNSKHRKFDSKKN